MQYNELLRTNIATLVLLFRILSLQPNILRWHHKSVINLTNANPAGVHEPFARSSQLRPSKTNGIKPMSLGTQVMVTQHVSVMEH